MRNGPAASQIPRRRRRRSNLKEGMTMRFEIRSWRSRQYQRGDLPEMDGFWLMLKSQTTGLQLLKTNGMRAHIGLAVLAFGSHSLSLWVCRKGTQGTGRGQKIRSGASPATALYRLSGGRRSESAEGRGHPKGWTPYAFVSGAIRLFSSFWGTWFAERCSALRCADRSRAVRFVTLFTLIYACLLGAPKPARMEDRGNPQSDVRNYCSPF